MVQRRHGRRGGRQLRPPERPQRRSLRTRQRPVRDHCGSGRHGRQSESDERHGAVLVGLRLHERWLPEAGGFSRRALHGRPDSDDLHARVAESEQHRLAGLHPALGHVVRGADRGRNRGADHRPQPDLGPGSDQGRADGDGSAHSVGDPGLARPRRGERGQIRDGDQRSEPEQGAGPVPDRRSCGRQRPGVSWDAVSWSDVSWGDSALAAVSWADISWSDVSWADSLSSADVSWADISWSDSSYEDAAEGDGAGNTADSFADSSDLAAAAADPDLQLPAALVSPDSTATTTTSLP